MGQLFGARASTPSSWRELLRRILRVVELAMLQAFLDDAYNASSPKKGRSSSPCQGHKVAPSYGEGDSSSSPCSRSSQSDVSTGVGSSASRSGTPNSNSGDEANGFQMVSRPTCTWLSNGCPGDAVEWQWSDPASGARGTGSRERHLPT